MISKPKVLLVYPPITKAERYGSGLGLFGGNQIPLGIFYLASYLKSKGIEAMAVDGEGRRLSAADIAGIVEDRGYSVVGISSTTVAFHRALELAAMIKERRPDVVTVIGGPHVSIHPSQPMEMGRFDYAIPNEGEETLYELVEALASGGDLGQIRGLVHRKDGKIVVNPPRGYVESLDTLPFPAYEMIPDISMYSPPPFNYKRRPVVNIITSRGCPFKCTFCESATFGKKIRLRGAENIANEIELVIREYGAREISFVDDTFTTSRKRIREIFTLTGGRGLSFPWSCMSRVDTVDDEALTFMRDNGLWYVALGIESGDENILKTIKKNIKLSVVEKVVAKCRELGIVTKGFFMIGHPGETLETIDKTIRFARSLPLDHVVVTINTPMPGSAQYAQVAEYGTLDESSWRDFNYWKPVFTPHGLTREIMLEKQKEFINGFYLRPGTLLRNAGILLSNPDYLKEMAKMAGNAFRFYLTPRSAG